MASVDQHFKLLVELEWALRSTKYWLTSHRFGVWSTFEVVLLAMATSSFLILFLRLIFSNFRKRSGKYLDGWKILTRDGYVRRILPSGRTQLEHRLVAQVILGRPLGRREVVHHINGRRSDNRPENLCVMDRLEHTRYHKWYKWIYGTYGKYPRMETQLRKLSEDFGGILLVDPAGFSGPDLRRGQAM